MAKVHLKKNEERRIKQGHLWVFSNEVAKTEGDCENGDIVEVVDWRKQLVGYGFINKKSLIAVRVLSGYKESIESFLKERILQAYKLRKEIYPNRKAYRLAFSESDFLPGLIIDKYNDTYALQVYSTGMEKNIALVVEILKKELKAKNIFSKNEEHFRTMEGLSVEDNIYIGEKTEEIISDGDVEYKIDFEKSHKTGFYFDQCDNRKFIKNIVKDKNVADCFCNSGGFGLHASKAGAVSVTFVDSSADEINNAKNNFELNKLKNKSEFVTADVFKFLEESKNTGRKFDIVMLDPPAFAKNKKNLSVAAKGYEKLNRMGMEILNLGGYFVTSSCSYHLSYEDFFLMLNNAALKTGKSIQLIYFNNASLDHPTLPAMEETIYLKFAVLKVV